ncbi:hypothetical protein F1559_003017 [Cyanidiococcus yangmingshanensis]|uniref:AB hydrolase-1 domain-containing protein n=1 Tax=Cyanidiococcus yangmingshanensis TaxID=2690220 RepID=A0A7J7IM96_9RHOD|nr:hypothetical protein F1559_003017 [Cyanidiococcus yangmingshanensis]
MLKTAVFFFVALEAQKCLARILGIEHPASERNLDALEAQALAEAGLKLQREYGFGPVDSTENIESTRGPYHRVRALREKWRRSSLSRAVDKRIVVGRRVALSRWHSSTVAACDQETSATEEWSSVQRRLDFSEMAVDSDEDRVSADVDSIPLRRCPSMSSLSSDVTGAWSGSESKSHADRRQPMDGYLSPVTDVDESDCVQSPSISTCSHESISTGKLGIDVDATSPFVHVLVAGDERAMFTGANPELRPLLLLHGHSMSSVYFRHVLAELASTERYVVYALDMLGWGRSSRPPFTAKGTLRDPQTEAEEASQFMVRAIDEFLYSSGIESWCRKSGRGIDVIAHSLGAYVASKYAVEASRGLIQNLILVTPAGIWPEQSYKRAVYFRLTPQLVMRNAGLLGYICFRLRWPGRDPGFQSRDLRRYTYALATRQGGRSADIAFAALVTVSHVRRKAQCLRALGQEDTAGASILKRLPCHVAGKLRIIAGAKDPLIGVHELERAYQTLYEAAPRKNQVSFCVIPECGHVPFVEQPARFLEACGLAEVPDPIIHDARISE